MGADTFEAREGWVPANTEGSVWCYRTRGNAGVLAFRRTEDGNSVYEATHQDCYASDETITTTRRVDAVRFAATGTGAHASAGANTDDPATATPGGSIEAATRADTPPAIPEAPASPALGDRANAMRNAWDRYIDATSEFLEHVKANLDDTTHGDLLGSVDQALALVRHDASKAPDHDPLDALPASLGAVLQKARALIATERLQR